MTLKKHTDNARAFNRVCDSFEGYSKGCSEA